MTNKANSQNRVERPLSPVLSTGGTNRGEGSVTPQNSPVASHYIPSRIKTSGAGSLLPLIRVYIRALAERLEDKLEPETLDELAELREAALPLLDLYEFIAEEWGAVDAALKTGAEAVFPTWIAENPGERTLLPGLTMRVTEKPEGWDAKKVTAELEAAGTLTRFQALDKAKVIRALKDGLELESVRLVKAYTPAVSRKALINGEDES